MGGKRGLTPFFHGLLRSFLNKQHRSYAASLVRQDVVSAAGGSGIHHLDANPGFDQRPRQLG